MSTKKELAARAKYNARILAWEDDAATFARALAWFGRQPLMFQATMAERLRDLANEIQDEVADVVEVGLSSKT